MRFPLFLALCFATFSAAQAQTAPTPTPLPGAAQAAASTPPSPTVDDAVRLAVQNNPSVTAAARDVSAAASGVRSAQALANPNAVFSPGITSISGTGEEFLLQQPLEINGTRDARTGVARAQLHAAQAQALVSLRGVVFTTKSAYYELVRAQEQAAVARTALQMAQEFDRIARRQVEEGVRPGIDLAQTSLEVSRVQRQIILADGQVTGGVANLNSALGRDPATPIGLLPPMSEHPTEAPALPRPLSGAADSDVVTLLNQALASRAEIAAGQAVGEQARQEARLARAEGRPDLVPQFRVGYFTRGLQPSNEGNGAGIGLVLTLPLLDYGSRRGRIRQAEQAAHAQDARVTATQNEVRLQVAQAFARQCAAEEVLMAYQGGGGAIEQARRLLEGSRTGFREGQTSVIALLEAQRTYRSVQTEYINAQVDAAIARAELERATGTIPADLLAQVRP